MTERFEGYLEQAKKLKRTVHGADDLKARTERQKAEAVAAGAITPAGPPLNPIEAWDDFDKALPHRDWSIRGLLQEASLYALTGFTGHAKTTLALYMSFHLAKGGFFASLEHEVKRTGTVVFISGENPANVRDQWLACCLSQDTHPKDVKVKFIRDRFDHQKCMPELLTNLAQIDDLVLVVVDTLQAFFLGDDDNSNAAMGGFAASWRPVCDLPSKPAVLINCHPAGKTAKAAKEGGLVPRGGGAFINEIDGNLTVWRDDEDVTIHWAGKFRGKYPEPIKMALEERTFDELTETDGERVPMAILKITTQQTRADKWREQADRETRIMYRIDLGQSTSEGALMDALGLSKRQVRNLVTGLINKKVVERNEVGGGLRLTRKGKAEMNRIKEQDGLVRSGPVQNEERA